LKQRPRLLDLFCGAGGAAKGYHDAGFNVVGVDINPQPHYPYEFIQADAMTFPLDGFDVIHASPPCQRYSVVNRGIGNHMSHPDLLPGTRDRLVDSGVPWVIENVVGAPMFFPTMLCGSMFGLGTSTGLWLRRHRLFECSHLFLAPDCRHSAEGAVIRVQGGNQLVNAKMSIGVYGNGTNSYHRKKLNRCVTVAEQREAMGIDWMPRS